MKYTVQKQLRLTDRDRLGRLKWSSLLSLMQEAADEHSKTVNLNNAAMVNNGHAWVLTRQAVVMEKPIYNAQCVEITTNALPSKTIEFPREYTVSTLEGDIIAYSLSHWSVIDTASRRVVRAKDVPNHEAMEVNKSADHEFNKIRANISEKEPMRIGEHRVVNGEIDILGHMNNTYYADIIMNALSDELFPKYSKQINLTYSNESRVGDIIEVYIIGITDESLHILGKRDNIECFVAELK